jgi:hypothetical protein
MFSVEGINEQIEWREVMNSYHTSVSQKRLRELGSRALRVIERHTSHVAVKAAAGSLVPAEAAYAQVYDDAIKYQASQSSEMELGRGSVVELDKVLKSTLALVRLAIPTFETGAVTGTVETPDRLIVDARRIIEILGHAGDSVHECKALIEALQAALDKAEQSWSKAQTARVALQQSQATVREQALAFNRELVALRRILRAVLGTAHLDYQTLRASRAIPVGLDDDDTVVEEEVDPYAQTQTQPTSQTPISNAGSSNGVAASLNGAPASNSGAASNGAAASLNGPASPNGAAASTSGSLNAGGAS